jgi:energy-coupling factor transporter ATP-binding protein EcfA2
MSLRKCLGLGAKVKIEILGKNMPIRIIEDWEVSIRPCEINNFSHIFGIDTNIKTSHKEYKELMKFLTQTGFSLDELIKQENAYYEHLKKIITEDAKIIFFEILDKCRDVALNNQLGQNIIKYLLYCMNNKIIKKQYEYGGCNMLSNLNLKWGCVPFDQMPFITSLINHNPRIHNLFECIDLVNREHELFARLIKNNTEMKGELFTSKEEIKGFENIENLIVKYNKKLYYKHTHRKLEIYKGFIYIKGYKEDTIKIIQYLNELSKSSIKDYSKSVKSWLEETSYDIDCEDKKPYFIKMFEESRVALIYGAAGTGKSTMINHVSNFFHDKRKLYLTNTNPAIDNLKRKVKTSNCEFMTIAKFLRSRNTDTNFSLLFIDESSTVGNADMLAVLEKASFQLVILVGDIFQIEAIRFGNWFEVSRSFLPKSSVSELKKPYRSNNEKLLELWTKVRNLEDDILEHITKNGYSTKLNKSIFENHAEDEIILCLNYDGLYGINNINSFLQSSNNNIPKNWDELVYKIDDPVLFNDTKRFGPSIYNNLKGKIVAIEILDKQIQFDIEIDKVLNETDVEWYELELLENDDENRSLIRFKVNKFKTTDEDEESSDAVIPFQIAYAVSIHKAQGLEYSSVKVVITDEIEEQITHNIFYTAITRAKDKLKIYWSPETESNILQNLKKRNNQRDVGLIKSTREI